MSRQAGPRRRQAAAIGLLVAGWALAGPGALGAQEVADPPAGSGRALYGKYCAQCHGDAGDGRGIAASSLEPAPRDFTSAKYRVRSTPTGALPTDEDLSRIIRVGVPYTAMPAFPDFDDRQMASLVEVVKSFSEDFADPELAAEPLAVPADPGFSAENAEAAVQVYEEIGCAGCHGRQGRGDGRSAPTLRDDWGQFIRAADLTRPWTFRGGADRSEIYQRISTGLSGTPMAGFAEALTPEQLWQLVDFITAISDGKTQPGYAQLVTAAPIEGGLDLERGRELFADAPAALFPLLGQIVQPGRQFAPAVIAVEARAVFDDEEIAFLFTWHDIQADTARTNSPDLEVPAAEERRQPAGDDEDEAEAAGDDFWGETAVDDAAAGDDFWGEAAAGEEEGAAAGEEGDFWGEEAAPAAAAGGAADFSDAFALQLPRQLPAGVRRPYFIFGDERTPVELWYLDLARPAEAQLWEGRGSANLALAEGGEIPEVRASYEDGEWSVVFKRRRQALQGITFPEDSFVPIAFSVWDGLAGERGSKRGLSSWYHVYLPPRDAPSPVVPMAKAAGLVALAEILLVAGVRRRRRRATATSPVAAAGGAAAPG